MVAAFLAISHVRAEEDSSNTSDRTAAWYNTQYGTTQWGGTWMRGQFGPDVGIGQQGSVFQYTDPMTGAYVSYSSTGLGMGAGGLFAGYGGWDSPLAAISYGPFAYGNTPQVMPTFGWNTQGSASGGLWAPQTSFYQAQPGLTWMLGGGLFGLGGFGGFGGFGGYPFGGFGGFFGGGWW